MNPLNAVGLALRAFSAGGDVFAKRSMAAMPPGNNVPPPPSVMPGPEFVDGAVDALAHQFQKMGFPMNDMVKAMIYRECDRRLAARMNEIHREGYEEGVRQVQLSSPAPEAAPASWFLILIGLAGAAALVWIIVSALRPIK